MIKDIEKLLIWHAIIIFTIILILSSISLLNAQEYKRRDFRHWIDEDHNGYDTRQEVLVEENLSDSIVIVKVRRKYKVIKGLWICAYTGDTITDPSKLDIDHLVPLKHAYEAGAKFWTREHKKKYANFLVNKNHLVAVTASSNRKKGAKSPAEWLPDSNVCWYIKSWLEIKGLWTLCITSEELEKIYKIETDCNCE